MLMKDYQLIAFKHCFPVSGIDEDGTSDRAEVAPLFCQRLVDVIAGKGDIGSSTGKAR